MSRRRTIALSVAAAALLAATAAPLLFVAADAGLLDGAVRGAFVAKTHRSLSFRRLAPHLLSAHPSVEVEDLVIGSPPAIAHEAMARIGSARFQLELLPLLIGHLVPTAIDASDVELHLVRLGHGRNNYSFGGAGLSPFLRRTRRLSLTRSTISYLDPERHLTLAGAAGYDSSKTSRPLSLDGGGEISGQPYRVQARGAPINGRTPHETYAFDATLQDGALSLKTAGVSQAPFDLRGFDLMLDAAGPNLADIGYLLNIGVPNSPTFRLTARTRRAGHVVDFRDIKARIGGSDLAGRFTSDHSRARRLLRASFTSQLIRAEDLAVLTAPRPSHAQTRSTPGAAARKTSEGPWSSKPLPVEGLRKIDLDFEVRADRLTGYLLPLNDVSGRLALQQGRLEARDLRARLGPGRASAALVLDVRSAVPKVRLTVDIRDAPLSALRPQSRPIIDGPLEGRLRLNGEGASMQAVVAHTDGAVEVRMHDGLIQQSKATALGGDPLRAAWQGLGRPRSVTPLRCARAVFTVRDGVMRTEGAMLTSTLGDTWGAGWIDLNQRRLDLRLTPTPGSASRTRVSPPILITGALDHPKVSTDMKGAIAKAGLAGVVAVVTTPLRDAKPASTPPLACPSL